VSRVELNDIVHGVVGWVARIQVLVEEPSALCRVPLSSGLLYPFDEYFDGSVVCSVILAITPIGVFVKLLDQPAPIRFVFPREIAGKVSQH
jgi:hypothetical protein